MRNRSYPFYEIDFNTNKITVNASYVKNNFFVTRVCTELPTYRYGAPRARSESKLLTYTYDNT
jgi:hypothetical protein